MIFLQELSIIYHKHLFIKYKNSSCLKFYNTLDAIVFIEELSLYGIFLSIDNYLNFVNNIKDTRALYEGLRNYIKDKKKDPSYKSMKMLDTNISREFKFVSPCINSTIDTDWELGKLVDYLTAKNVPIIINNIQ